MGMAHLGLRRPGIPLRICSKERCYLGESLEEKNVSTHPLCEYTMHDAWNQRRKDRHMRDIGVLDAPKSNVAVRHWKAEWQK